MHDAVMAVERRPLTFALAAGGLDLLTGDETSRLCFRRRLRCYRRSGTFSGDDVR